MVFTLDNLRSVLVCTLVLLVVVSGSLSVTPPPPVNACNTCNFQLKWGSAGSANGQFNGLESVTVDSSGDVYVADRNNNRIQKFNGTGTYLSQLGCASGACSGGSVNGQFNLPRGVAVDSGGNVYVADTINYRVEKFTSAGAFSTAWGSSGFGSGQFNIPWGVAVDSSGNVYVADEVNNRVEKFTSAGVYVTAWGCLNAGNGCLSGSGDGEFNLPRGVAVDSTGNVYVVDAANNRVEKFSGFGSVFVGWAGGCTSGSNCISGTSNGFTCTLATCGAPIAGSNNGQFNSPNFVAVDSGGNVYVTDYSNNRVEKFDSSGTFQLKWGSVGNGDGRFNGPNGVAVDSGGNVYVTDAGNSRVEKFGDPTTSITVTSNPAGSGFVTVDDSPAATPALFSWTIGSTHNLTASSSVIGSGAQYVWVSWSDGSARSHNITVPSVPTTYTANFKLTNYAVSVNLVAGWNLISLPVVPVNPTIGNVLSGLIAAKDFTVVWSYQAGAWKSFSLPSTGPLTTMQDGFGYWIYMTRPGTLLILGYTISPPQENPSKYTLSSGWNLVGFRPQSPTVNETVGQYLTTISGKYLVVQIYNNTSTSWTLADSSTWIVPGQAMWIYVTTPATLVPE